jgi:molecular chaperone GrpE
VTDEHPFEEDAPIDAAPPAGKSELEDLDGVAPDAGDLDEPPPSAVARLREQLSAATDQHLRLAAEFDNFRKRIARERLELSDRAQAGLVARILDVLDDLDRLAATAADAPHETVAEAIDLVDRKLRKELELAGLERVDPVGTRFDPTDSEAVSVLPAPDPAKDDEVALTFQVGYRFKGTLVRPARVQVYSTDGQL